MKQIKDFCLLFPKLLRVCKPLHILCGTERQYIDCFTLCTLKIFCSSRVSAEIWSQPLVLQPKCKNNQLKVFHDSCSFQKPHIILKVHFTSAQQYMSAVHSCQSCLMHSKSMHAIFIVRIYVSHKSVQNTRNKCRGFMRQNQVLIMRHAIVGGTFA